MSALTLRLVKGSPLTNTELDNNFTALNNDKLESATAASTYQTIAGMSSYLPLSGGTLTGPSVVSVNSSGDALRITQTGAGNALLVEDSANPDSSPFAILSNGQVIQGATQAYTTTVAGTNYNPTIQMHAANANTPSIGYEVANWATTTGAGSFSFAKSRGGVIGTHTVVNSNDSVGETYYFGSDGTNFIEAARIGAAVDGTPGTNDMPGRLVFSTTADGASSPTERMRIDNAGRVGIGASSLAGFGVRQSNQISGNSFSRAYLIDSTNAADVTNTYIGFGTALPTANAVSNLQHFSAGQGTLTGAVTNQFGFNVASSLTGATNNFGFYGNIASGTGRWNFYAAGTASNYLAGPLYIGQNYYTTVGVGIFYNSGGANSTGIYNDTSISSTTTGSYVANSTYTATAAAAFTLQTLTHYQANQSTIGAGSSVTNQYGFNAGAGLIGATNNYGFFSSIPSGTGRYNFYAAGTAANYFAGNVGIGNTAPLTKLETYATTNDLQIISSVRNDNAGSGVAAIGFNVSSTAAGDTSAVKAGIGLVRQNVQGVGQINFYNRTTTDTSSFTSSDIKGAIGSTGVWSLGAAPGSESLRVTPVASAVNYWNFNGSTTGNEVPMYASGSDTNIGIVLATKGTGSTFIQSNGGVTQFRVAHTASAVNYVQVTGGDGTTNSPRLSATGSSADISVQLLTKGTGAFAVMNDASANQFRVSPTASAVNYLQATGATTGNATTLSAQGGDTNIPILLFPKGTGGTYLRGQLASGVIWGANAVLITPGVAQGEQSSVSFRSTFTGTADNQPRRAAEIFAGYSGGAWGNEFLTLAVGGISGNDAMATPKAALTLTNPVSSVNYLQITGATAGSWPTFSATGSDASVGLIIAAKGTSGITSSTGGGTQFYVANTASAVNYIQATGAATGNGATLSAQGSDTNVDLRLASKGAGKVVVPGTAYSPEITLTDGATVNWDASTGQVAKLTLGGNRTIAAPTNLATGAFYSLNLIQDATGSRTITWNSVFAFTGGTAPTLSTAASAVDQICFRYDGTKLREVGRSLGAA